MRRPVLALAVVFAGTLLFAGACAREGGDRELHVVWDADVPSLDPNERFDVVTATVASNVFEPLLRYDRQMSFEPCLAKGWEARDGAVWRFRLREGVSFHDGTKLSAEDVAFSIERLRRRRKWDIHRYVSAITDVRVVDPLTVEIRSERPAGLLSVLSYVFVLPKRSVEAAGEAEFFRAPAGTGPYRIASWKPGETLRLEAYPAYWGGPSAVSSVVFRVEKDDEATWDEAKKLAPAILFAPTTTSWIRHRDDPAFRLVEQPSLAVHYLAFRVGGGPSNPLSDIRVRRALRAAIDYEALLAALPAHGAFPASQFVPPAIVGFDPSLAVPEFVPGAARRMLAEAGFRQEKPLVFLTSAGGGAISRYLIEAFAAAGVSVREESVPPDEYESRLATCDADAYLTGWICTTGDAGELFEGNFYRRGSTRNPCGYGCDEMDTAIEEIGRTLDPAVRRDLLQSAMRRLVDDLPWVPLVVSYERHALTRGVEWTARADGQLDLRDVRIR
ncbi:MAG TPA: ABC transporter substrate-binding protein [Thermoanaerobaculia bacterium]|nr:ABC transporter substrate-binding protein [Thermoanaerobaculia bacterium]HPA52349.1 ABC transporter substrate-binding protein [Thermoanaerobaculia bacterium]HQN07291.1 ABC transporter substrate-binding protein [Thermoanaerobaculia bacterium]HQP86570.1 ABC transporter substrate-binding protein [Thermoanaerobaculia bacterium]